MNNEITTQSQAMQPFQSSSRAMSALQENANTVALSEMAKAKIQAQFIIAMQRPRNMMEVRRRILEECRRPGFAAVGKYTKPIGKDRETGKMKYVTGPSIRLMEACIRFMGNLLIETTVKLDNTEQRLSSVSIIDLETNTTYSKDIPIAKVVEKSYLRDGQSSISERTNSQGKRVYLVAATEDDVAIREAALVSKTMRMLGERLTPRDIIDEAMEVVEDTLKKQTKDDPRATLNKMLDAYAKQGVTPNDLREYMDGRDLTTLAPADVDHLREVFTAIVDGEVTWKEIVAAKQNQEDTTEPFEPTEPKANTDLKAKLQGKAKPSGASATAPVAPQVPVTSSPPPTPPQAPTKPEVPQTAAPSADEHSPPPQAPAPPVAPKTAPVAPPAAPVAPVAPSAPVAPPPQASAPASPAKPKDVKAMKGTFVLDNAAWKDHLASLSTPQEMARDYHLLASDFRRANVSEQRRETTINAIAALVSGDVTLAEGFLSATKK